MSEKSVQKRNYIIEKAREVFSQKGYLTVTMKDIVEACEISRGGLKASKRFFWRCSKKKKRRPTMIWNPHFPR